MSRSPCCPFQRMRIALNIGRTFSARASEGDMRKSVGKDSPFPTDLRQNAQHDETRTKHGWRFPRKLRAKGPAKTQ